jgi:RimJ/RimL family protein N-acetyltransferase
MESRISPVKSHNSGVTLEPITAENRAAYARFEEGFASVLTPFMSRLHPNRYEEYEMLIGQNLLRWFYIVADGKRIGSIWLEKEQLQDRSAVLGLFLFDEHYRALGIGETVIRRILREQKDPLNLSEVILRVRVTNPRGIRCYEKCGFHEVGRGIGHTGVEGIEMKKLLME